MIDEPARHGLTLDGSVHAGEQIVSVALHVGEGETVALVGPNGAGKTTVLRAVAGLLPLTVGTLRLDARTLDDPSQGVHVPPEARSIGVVFQDVLLFAHLDVLGNVAFGPRALGRARPEAETEARRWLERMGVAHLVGADVGTLSGGEAQRVALARALAAEPRALLLDEPLAALDAEVRGTVRRDLRDHLRAHAGPCIVVTHDLVDAAVLADRVVVLEAGVVTATGTVDELVAHPRSAWAAELAGTNLLPATAAGLQLQVAGGGTITVADAPGDGPVLVAVRPAAVSLHPGKPSGSPRNVWEATVSDLERTGDRVRVRLAGDIPLVAEVTSAAVAELGLGAGSAVWASVKATDLRAYPA